MALIAGASFVSAGSATAAVGRTVELLEVDSLQSPTARSVSGAVPDAASERAYLIDELADEIVIYDTSGDTLAEAGRVPAGSSPSDLALNSTTHQLLVSDADDETLTVIDVDPASPTADTVVATHATLGTDAISVGVDEVANVAYVANNSSDDVAVVNLTTGLTVLTTVDAGPADVAVDSQNHTAYIACQGTSTITVVVESAATVRATVPGTPQLVEYTDGQVLVATETPAGAPTDFRLNAYDVQLHGTATSPALDSTAVSVSADPELGLAYVTTASGLLFAYRLDGLLQETPDPLLTSFIESAIVEPQSHRVFTTRSERLGGIVRMYDQRVSPLLSDVTFPPAQVGVPFRYQVEALAWPAPSSYGATGLPAGLVIDAATGEISGTPAASGTFGVTVTADNGAATQGTTMRNLVVAAAPATAPAITSGPPPAGRAGTPYSHRVTSSGSPAPQFRITNGALPAGLTLSADGLISGTPTASGTTAFTVTATNAAGSDSDDYRLLIEAAAPTPTPTPTPSPTPSATASPAPGGDSGGSGGAGGSGGGGSGAGRGGYGVGAANPAGGRSTGSLASTGSAALQLFGLGTLMAALGAAGVLATRTGLRRRPR